MAIICSQCGASNRDTARFCSGCSMPLLQAIMCPVCGAANQVGARYCQQCATPLAAGAQRSATATGMLASGSLLAGRYHVVQRVGKGGMGAVYKGTDTRLGQKVVAVKELSLAAFDTEQDRQQAVYAFKQEAEMLARLKHRHLPNVTDHFGDGGREYLVMEFIDGNTLEELLERSARGLDAGQVLAWAEQLCDVLDYLHKQKPPVVFRDLKPANIMVDRSGAIKLIDFGIARHFKAGKTTDTVSFGTAGYAPPEQYGKGQTDARSDIYALGATLHHLLTGRDPSQSPFSFPSVRSLNAAVPQGLDDAIVKAVAQDPAQRWQSVAEMKAALKAAPSGHAALSSAPAVAYPASAAPASPAIASASASAAKPKVSIGPAPAIARSGFWATVIIGIVLGAASCIAVAWEMALQMLPIAGQPINDLVVVFAFLIAAPLAYEITRRPWVVFVTSGAQYMFVTMALDSGYLSVLDGVIENADMFLASAVLWPVLVLRGARPPKFLFTLFASMLYIAAAFTILNISETRDYQDVIRVIDYGILGSLVGIPVGIVAYLIGRLFRR